MERIETGIGCNNSDDPCRTSVTVRKVPPGSTTIRAVGIPVIARLVVRPDEQIPESG